MVWFGLVSLFIGISTFVGYLKPNTSLKKNRCDTTQPIVVGVDERIHTKRKREGGIRRGEQRGSRKEKRNIYRNISWNKSMKM